jgi:hypothetical protein
MGNFRTFEENDLKLGSLGLGGDRAKNTEVFMERVTWRRRKTNWR